MIKLKEVISRSLFVESKKLRVFDMDDTLVQTTSFIYLTTRKGNTHTLTPAEYATYTPRSGDEFDYSDFNDIREPRIIKGYFEILRKMASKGGGDRGVYILTARSKFKPVHMFIRQTGIRNVYVVALGDSNPEKKADWIEDKVKKDGYDDVFFVDDSMKNVDAVRKRLSSYPYVKKQIKLVTHSGTTNENVKVSLKTII